MRRAVIVLGVLALVVSTLVQPWIFHQTRYVVDSFYTTTKTETRGFAGYHWVGHEPQAVEKFDNLGGSPSLTISYELDARRMMLEWILILLVTAGLSLAVRKNAQPKGGPPDGGTSTSAQPAKDLKRANDGMSILKLRDNTERPRDSTGPAYSGGDLKSREANSTPSSGPTGPEKAAPQPCPPKATQEAGQLPDEGTSIRHLRDAGASQPDPGSRLAGEGISVATTAVEEGQVPSGGPTSLGDQCERTLTQRLREKHVKLPDDPPNPNPPDEPNPEVWDDARRQNFINLVNQAILQAKARKKVNQLPDETLDAIDGMPIRQLRDTALNHPDPAARDYARQYLDVLGVPLESPTPTTPAPTEPQSRQPTARPAPGPQRVTGIKNAEVNQKTEQARKGGRIEAGSYSVEWDARGLVIRVTDYHAGPLGLSWSDVLDLARRAGHNEERRGGE